MYPGQGGPMMMGYPPMGGDQGKGGPMMMGYPMGPMMMGGPMGAPMMDGRGGAPSNGMKPGDWTCPGCGEHCFARRTECRRCNAPRPPGMGGEFGGAFGGG